MDPPQDHAQTAGDVIESGTELERSMQRNMDEEPTGSGHEDRREGPYPNYANYPYPLTPGSSRRERTGHAKVLNEYTDVIIETYYRMIIRGEMLWSDFITAFHPYSIWCWTGSVQVEWRVLPPRER